MGKARCESKKTFFFSEKIKKKNLYILTFEDNLSPLLLIILPSLKVSVQNTLQTLPSIFIALLLSVCLSNYRQG